MLKAELSYNPYSKKTIVKFNGKDPRINSLIEKYSDERLQDWINEVPLLFKDEMNGYDFNLDFIGTELEYEEVKKVFENAVNNYNRQHSDMDDESVNVDHAVVLMDRPSKVAQIDEFLSWLSGIQSDIFQQSDFFDDNSEIVNYTIPLKVVNGTEEDVQELNNNRIIVEYIDELNQLREVENLQYNPIIICLDDDYLEAIHLIADLVRKDASVNDNQVFLYPRDKSYIDKIKKVVEDLGINNASIIESCSDKVLLDYIDEYPLSQGIYECIQFITQTKNELDEVIKEKGIEIEENNKEDYQKIRILDDSIARIEKSMDFFENYLFPRKKRDYDDIKIFEINKFKKWKEKNVVITGEEDARKEADSLAKHLSKISDKFQKAVKKDIEEIANEIIEYFAQQYDYSGLDASFIDKTAFTANVSNDYIEDIKDLYSYLLNSGETRLVEEKHMKFMAKAETTSVVRKQYDVALWRAKSSETLEKIMDKTVDIYHKAAVDFLETLDKYYYDELHKYQEIKHEKRNEIIAQLSDVVKDYEKEKAWVDEMSEKVQVLVRS